MEAGTGIEPVFTDLQSRRFHRENNDLSAKEYQDIARTGGERDTAAKSSAATAKEIPDALAGAIEVKSSRKAASLPCNDTLKPRTIATHFWDRGSNSVEPLCVDMVLA